MKILNVLALCACFSACAPATRLITRPAAKEPAVAQKSSATVVVGNVMNWKVLNLFDGRGKVIGQLTGRSHTVLQHPPGAFKLYVVPEKQGSWGDRVEGTLEAGRVYFLQVGMRFGGVSMQAVSARTSPEEWPNRQTYVNDLDRVNVDPAQLSGLEADLGDIQPLIAEVDGVVSGFDAEQKKARTIEPADGET